MTYCIDHSDASVNILVEGKMKKSTFGKRLSNIRELSGLTQSELAEKSKLDPSCISHFESGRRDPNLENLIKIVKALGISADILLGTARP